MKLQSASKKEIRRITIGTLICDAIMIAALFILSLVGVGTFSYRVFLGAAGGTIIAILNFTIMCLTIQKATGIGDQKTMRSFIQGSYNGRLAMQAVWVVIAIAVPQIHVVAGAAPLLFPNVVIYYLNAKGKLMPPDPPRDSAKTSGQEEEADGYLGPFEV